MNRFVAGVRPLSCAAALLIGAIVLQGCETVEPWQRATLAKPIMALDVNSQDSTRRLHTFASREAANGAASMQGGGCGCN
jgi:hypothetical protein